MKKAEAEIHAAKTEMLCPACGVGLQVVLHPSRMDLMPPYREFVAMVAMRIIALVTTPRVIAEMVRGQAVAHDVADGSEIKLTKDDEPPRGPIN